jgi:hypothetical protein
MGFKKMGSWLTHDKPENLVHFILEDVGRGAQFIHDKAGSGAQTFDRKVDRTTHSKHYLTFNNNFLFLVYPEIM